MAAALLAACTALSAPLRASSTLMADGSPDLCSSPPDIMVINMDRRDRLDDFASAARTAHANATLCRIRAVQGSALPDSLPQPLITPDEWKRALERFYKHEAIQGRALTPGAVGLAFAHARAWMRMVARRTPWAIVAEDDVRAYVPAFAASVRRACETALMSGGLELIQLQADHHSWPKPSDGRLSATQILEARAAWPTRVTANTGHNTGMYLITLEGARHALARVFPLSQQIDEPGGTLRGHLRSGMCDPPIAQVGALGTSIQIGPSTAAAPRSSADAVSASTPVALPTNGDISDCSDTFSNDGDVDFVQRLASAVSQEQIDQWRAGVRGLGT